MPAFWAELVDALPDRLDRGRPRRGRLGRLGAADERARRPRPARRRRPLRHEPGAAPPGDRARRRQLDPRQGEPDRDADRDDRGGAARAVERLHGGDVAPLGRDRGRDDRRPRGRARHRPDQDGRPRALRPRRRSTTSCSGSRRSSATGRVYPGWSALPAGASRIGSRAMADRPAPHEDRRHDRARLVGPGGSEAADGHDRRRPPELLARHPRGPRGRARRRSARCRTRSGSRVALIADLQGPKLRVGELAEPVVARARRGR